MYEEVNNIAMSISDDKIIQKHMHIEQIKK